MDERNSLNKDWDDSVYGTGPTQPPKDNGGPIAVLLILVIFLLGIVTVLGLLNVKLFRQLRETEKNLAMSFSVCETVPEETTPQETVFSGENREGTFHLSPTPVGTENVPQEGGMSLQDIYTMNIPSVVSITCARDGSSSTGTGVIFDADGYIITNAHVVDKAVAVQIQLTDNRILAAQILGSDDVSDLAVLRIEASDLTAAQFGDSSSLRVGDTVVAIGDPLGAEFRGTYTDGIVSAINRDVDVNGHTMTLIQTNAALNSGNSGGPLINCYGQVIGINTMKISDIASSAGVEGLGFAIPSATVCTIAQQLITQGYVSGRPTLGLEGETMQRFYQHYYDLPSGLYITKVDRGSDAYNKGIRERDILISVDGERITTMTVLKQALQDHQVGDVVEVIIYRAGNQYQLELTLTEDKG